MQRFWDRTRLVCLGALASAAIWGQVTTATIHGTVTDPTGAAVPGSSVHLMHQETGATATKVSGEAGGFQFDFLPVGTYTILIETEGFKRFEARR